MMKGLNLHGHRTSVAAEPLLTGEQSVNSRYSCLDGVLTSYDVAKVAGVSRKAARRAVDRFCAEHDDSRVEPGGATLTFDSSAIPDPATQTRAQMARFVAERLGLGHFGLKKRIAERATRPPAKRGKRMSTQQHPWKVEKHGRSIKAQEGGAVVAKLTCSKCPEVLTIRFRQLCDAGDMDRKFSQQGWAVDPAKCPAHNRRNHQPQKETRMSAAEATFAAPSPAAIAAQAKMFGLLQGNFDPDTGTYGAGYSDAKIAEECRLSVELVAAVRKQTFGDLKVPAEVEQLTNDIEALESLLNESIAPIQSELRALKARVTECCKRFGG
jgi:hypothetical protein